MRRDRGSILVIALVVLVAVSFIALTLAREARIEIQIAARTADEVRLRAIVDSAVDAALAQLKLDDTISDTLTDEWRDDEPTFRNVQCGEGHYWIRFGEEDPGDGHELKYGLRDENSKLNINLATANQLLQLPGMTSEISDSILDWIDADENPRAGGAESAYYNALIPGYTCKNGPIESMEEMLRIKGIDESILYGEDRNRNGWLDPSEDDGDRSYPPDDSNGVLLRGLADYLTVYSFEQNVTRDGRARLNVTSARGTAVHDRLVKYGVASNIAQNVQTYLRRPGPALSSIGELVNVPGMDETNMTIVGDELCLSDAPQIPGLININTAAQEILLGLNGLTQDDVTAIMTARLAGGESLQSPAWLLHVLTPKSKVAAIWNQISTRSWQFTIHVAAAIDDHPWATKRVEVVVDRGYVPARVLWRRDITNLGFPWPGERGDKAP